MSDEPECNGRHAWEVWSGDHMNCMFCDAEGVVHVTFEPEEIESE
jgi:hypothetical protein